MSSGSLTFGSLARLSEYRSGLAKTAKLAQSKASPIPTKSSQIPNSPVDSRTEQALKWSGLKPAASSHQNSNSSFFSNSAFISSSSQSTYYSSPELDFTYSLSSIKGILAYRDALAARTPPADESSREAAES